MVTNFWLLWPVLVFGGCVAGQGVRGVSTPGLSDADRPFLLPITAADSVKITGALSADRAVAVAFAQGNRMQILAPIPRLLPVTIQVFLRKFSRPLTGTNEGISN